MSQQDTKSKYQKLIEQCDLLIKSGQLNQVRHLIGELTLSKIPRESRSGLAKICRRAGMISQGLRLLHPIIRQQKENEDRATASETCEYAVLLSRNGSVQEALSLLEKVDFRQAPESLLYMGLCEILNWNYEEAAKHFQKFLSATSDDYSKLIARVNLASCYIVLSQFQEAQKILASIMEQAQKAGATRLVGNCYELNGQVCFWQNDFSKARHYLKLASQIFGAAHTHDRHLILKTESIMSALERKSTEPLLKFRELARQEKVWESVREADLFLVKVQFDQKRLDHLIYGTPMQFYRSRIQSVLGHSPSESFVLGDGSSLCLDLQTGKIDGRAELLPGRKVHQVIASLVQDFYLPRKIGQLFADLYPGEYFNMDSSPLRVRQLIKRSREWLQDNQIEAQIEQTAGHYRFAIEGQFGIRIPLHAPTVEILEVRWKALQSAFGSQVFSAEQACESLRIPRSTFGRLARWACEQGQLEISGVGRSTRYRISNRNSHKTAA